MADRLPTSSSSGRRRREADASIGDFVIGGEIGKGSFAQVYSGYHKVRALFCSSPVFWALASPRLAQDDRTVGDSCLQRRNDLT